MTQLYIILRDTMEHYKNDLINSFENHSSIDSFYCGPDEPDAHYYARQIISYANLHDYYANLSFDKCWGRFFFQIDKVKIYRMVISIHHYGYDNSTFAVGAFLSTALIDPTNSSNEFLDIPLSLPPLTISSEKEVHFLKPSIKQQIEFSIMTVLAYIANEL